MERRVAIVLGGLALVGASLALDRTVQFDPQGWLLWGREITSSGLRFSTETYPSWKPLPFLFALPLSLAGGAAPALWLAIERGAALCGLAVAYSLGRAAAGRAAGLLAAAAVALAPGWVTFAIDGRSEPMVIALLFGALAAHRARRGWVALVLLALAALDRPEALALACGYALVAWRAGRRTKLAATALIALVPLAWLGGDWLGSGDPLHGAKLALESAGARAHGFAVLGALAGDFARGVGAPLMAGAGVAVALALRRRDRRLLLLAALPLAWLTADAALLVRGYPESEIPRFALPAVAAGCLLGAIGVARAVMLARPARARALALVAALALLVPFGSDAVENASAGVRAAAWYASSVDSLGDAVADAGGRHTLLRCGHLAVDQWAEPTLAWRLGVEPQRLGWPGAPGIVLVLHGARYPALRRYERRHARASVRRIERLDRWTLLYAGRPLRGCALAASRAQRS